MALRWSKTLSAYKKYRWMFSRPLPLIIESNSPISQASYIRDIIKYARDNNLPGCGWYGKVKVSPEEGKIIIRSRKPNTDLCNDYPHVNLFTLLQLIQDGTASTGFRFTSDDTTSRLNDILEKLNLAVKDMTLYLELTEKGGNG